MFISWLNKWKSRYLPANLGEQVRNRRPRPRGRLTIEVLEPRCLPAASLTVSPTALNLGTTPAGFTGLERSYTISGSELTGKVVITAPAGVEVSPDVFNDDFQPSIFMEPNSDGSFATRKVYVRISASAAAGSIISGNVTNTSDGVGEQDVSVSGSVNGGASLTVSPTSLNLGTTSNGVAGTIQTYTISGGNLTGSVAISAPSGVELSLDGNSFSSSLTVSPSDGTLASTTIDVRISASAAGGNVSGNITNTTSGTSEMDVTVSGSVNSGSTLTVSPTSLNLGTTLEGTPGNTQTFTISGSDLGGDVTIQAPTGVEVSPDGVNFGTKLTISLNDSATLNPEMVYVRIGASASPGTISANIACTSPGAAEQDVLASGIVNAQTPSLTVSPSSLDLGTTTPGMVGSVQTYTLSGSNLTGDVIIKPPTGVEVSNDDVNFYGGSLTFQLGGSTTLSPETVYVRISASAVAGNFIDKIADTSPGATEQDVVVSGTVNGASLTIGSTSLDLGSTTTNMAGSIQTFTISGSNLTDSVVIRPPAGVEVSTDGANWVAGPLAAVLNPASGTLASTTISVRISMSASAGTISGNIACTSSGATEQDVSISGTVNATTPTLMVSPSSLDLGTTTNNKLGSLQTFTISGSNLTDNVTIAAPTGVDLSMDGVTYQSSLQLPPTDGMLASMMIDVRISSSAQAGSIGGNIACTSPGAAEQDIAVSGTVNAGLSLTVSTTSLDLGKTTFGTPGSVRSFVISGSNLTSDVMVSAPTGVLVSMDGTTFESSVTLPVTDGTLGSMTILASISDSAPIGSISGNIACASQGATEQDISVNGTVNPVASLMVSPSSLDLGTTTAGTAGTAQSYTISASNLTQDVVITAPAGVEVSLDGTTFVASRQLTPINGMVSATIYVRISDSATAGSIGGDITNNGFGAPVQHVSVSGTVNGAAASGLTVSPTALNLRVGSVQTYTISGTNLSAGVIITAPLGDELSVDGTGFARAQVLPLTSSGTLASTTVYVRIFAGSSAFDIIGKITNVSPGVAEKDVSVSFDSAAPSLMTSPTELDLGTTTAGMPGSMQMLTIAGSNLTGNVTIAAPAGVEVSSDGTTWMNSGALHPDGSGSVSVTLSVRIAGTAMAGSIEAKLAVTSPGAAEQDVPVIGTVNAGPTLMVSPASLDLGKTMAGAPGMARSYTISGSNLTDNVIVSPPSGVELSSDGSSFQTTPLTLTPVGGTLASTPIYVRSSAGATPGSLSGSITDTSSGATEKVVAVSGTIDPATAWLWVSPSSLDLGTAAPGIPGTVQSYFISGTNLTDNVVVTAPAGVEVSSNGTSFGTIVTLFPDSAGKLASTQIDVRIADSAPVGNISGSIANTGSGAMEKDVAVSGAVNEEQVQFSMTDFKANEHDGMATITLTRTGGNSGKVTVHVTSSDGTATSGSDYTAVDEMVTFNPGDASASFAVKFLNNNDGTVILASSAPTGATLGTPSSAVLTIWESDLYVTGVPITGKEGELTKGTVATFTDIGADGSDALDDYKARIDWGDGHQCDGTIVQDGPGQFHVDGSNTYDEASPQGMPYMIKVTITEPGPLESGVQPVPFTAQAPGNIADVPLHVEANHTLHFTEGVLYTNQVIATITDDDPGRNIADYMAVIDYGDGTMVRVTSTSAVYLTTAVGVLPPPPYPAPSGTPTTPPPPPPAGTPSPDRIVPDPTDSTKFDIVANVSPPLQPLDAHLYAEESFPGYDIKVTVCEADNWANTVSADTTAPTDDGYLTAIPFTFNATRGVEYTGTVAKFTDVDFFSSESDYQGTIDWGDGTKSLVSSNTGAILEDPTQDFNKPRQFIVIGTHTFATGGPHQISATIEDVGPPTTVVATSTVVLDYPPTITSDNNTTFTLGVRGGFTIITQGSPTPQVNLSSDAPSWLTVTNNPTGTAQLAGAPPASAQSSYTFTITASNGISPDFQQTFTLNVSGMPPMFTSAASTTFQEGGANSFPVTVSGISTPIFGQSGALPAGVSLDPMTGILFGMPARHTAGKYPITLTVSDGGSLQVSESFTLIVTGLQLSTRPITATETATFSKVIATFTDRDPQGPISNYSATIDWGDGTTSTADVPSRTIVRSGRAFAIRGSHRYTEEGTYTVTVTLTDLQATVQGTSSANVLDAPLKARGTTVRTSHGTAFSGIVASFTDPGTDGSPADYIAVINWGDGNTSTASGADGSITTSFVNNRLVFYVTGTNTYAFKGKYRISVWIVDVGGQSPTAFGQAVVK
jgi:hypothetical protein